MNGKSILLCLALLIVLIAESRAGERLLLEVFPYSKVGQVEDGLVENLLRQKLLLMAQEPTHLPGIALLKVQENKSPYPENDVALAQHWAAGNALAILSGAAFNQPSGVRLVSNIYLGERNGSLETKVISISVDITPNEYMTFRDLHSAVTLYALAMEAKANGKETAVICSDLVEAQLLLQSLSKTGTASDVEKALLAAIDKEFALLKR